MSAEAKKYERVENASRRAAETLDERKKRLQKFIKESFPLVERHESIGNSLALQLPGALKRLSIHREWIGDSKEYALTEKLFGLEKHVGELQRGIATRAKKSERIRGRIARAESTLRGS